MIDACEQAEMLAGAIALGEATDLERERYRRHISACASCLNTLGGEREIERTMDVVAQARDAENWEPVLASVQSKHRRRFRALTRFAVPAAAAAIAGSLGMHFFAASFVRPINIAPTVAAAPVADVMHVSIERRPPSHAAKTQAPPRMVIVHNVITLKAPLPAAHAVSAAAPAPAAAAPAETKSTTVVAQASATAPPETSDVPIWRRGVDPIRRRTIASAPGTLAPILTGRAESIAMSPSLSVRDVMPLGGDTTINPEPPMIAYREGAEGTTAFEVSVDERGLPTKCTITKSSGYLVLDNAVCRAAMKARFSPRTVNGRAVPGIYRDAFTFRNTTNNEGIE